MATRKRPKAKPPEAAPQEELPTNGPVRFVEVPTAPLVVLAGDDQREVTGAFVKLAPRLRRSERAAFDGPGGKRQLLERGARAVVVAPITLPDEEGAEPVLKEHVDPRAELKRWFENADEDGREAERRCLVIIDEVGM